MPPRLAVGQREEILVTFCGPNILNELMLHSQGVFNTVLAYIQCDGTQLVLTMEWVYVWPPLLQLCALSKQAESIS